MPIATIVIKDEVNCKIENLDINARKKLMKTFKYEKPGARHMPAVRLGRWDGCVNFFHLAGNTFINLLPEIIPILDEYNYTYLVDDQRVAHPEFVFAPVTADENAAYNWPTGHRLAGQPIMLDTHQLEVINAFLDNNQGMSRASTGSGKTIVTATLAKKVEPYGRTIVIVPNKSLVSQTEDDFKLLGLDVGVYFGDRKDIGKTHTICTWQSLSAIIRAKKKGEETKASIEDFTDGLVCVIVDEAHASKADDLHNMLSSIFANVPIRWGLTGTIPKEKFAQVSLRVNLGEVISEVSAVELQEKGFLSNCHIEVLQLKDHGEFKDYQQELQYLVTNPDRIRAIAKLLDSISSKGNTLILVDRIATGTMLMEEMENEAIFINGGVGVNKRKEHYNDIADTNDVPIIATYGVAAVGINVPRIFNVVLFEPGKSFVRVIQSIGRGLRKAHDKDFVQIYDLTSTLKYSKRHLTARKAFYSEAEYPFNIKKIDWRK